MQKFNKEQQDKIIQMYKDNTDMDTILSCFNTTEDSIRFILKENLLDRKCNRFSEELYNRIASLYLKGNTYKYISSQVLIAENSVGKILKKMNIPKRTYSMNNRRYTLDEHYFDKIDTENKAYILGILYADGCNYTEHNAINITLQESDVGVLERIKEELKYSGPLRYNKLSNKNKNYQNVYILCINSEYLSKKLNELGLVPKKSLILEFPDFIPENLLRHFVRGYFDGDGCIYWDQKRNKCSTQTCSSDIFCEKLSKIMLNMGCKNCIKSCHGAKEQTKVIQTGGNKSTLKYLSWMYNDCDIKLERKYQKYKQFVEFYTSKMIA